MATRCRIAIQNTDKSYHSVYCHFDGYPQHTGKLLAQYWTDISHIERLMNLGDVSVLDRNHDKTRFYHRDLLEQKTNALFAENFDELLLQTTDCGGEYVYAFIDNKWFYHVSENDGTDWIPIVLP
jgi:hypothetical protein